MILDLSEAEAQLKIVLSLVCKGACAAEAKQQGTNEQVHWLQK